MTQQAVEWIVQFGFAGFCAALLGVLVWLVRQLLQLQRDSSDVIARNTEAVHDLLTLVSDSVRLLREVHNKLLARPCIAREE